MSKKNNSIFSGHETFPLRYGWLKKVYDIIEKSDKTESSIRDIFYHEDAISIFGVGKNMVASMRHWANQIELLDENQLTPFAVEIFNDENGVDPWIESPTTLWLIHWKLCKKEELVTYHWFYNYFNSINFDRRILNEEIMEYCNSRGNIKLPSEITLKRDIECFIRLYAPKSSSGNEDSVESPLAELNLIQPIQKQGYFTVNRGSKPNISLFLFWYVTLDFWLNKHKGQSSISLESLTYDPCSPGRIFLLTESALIDLIYQSDDLINKKLHWSETAGMKQISLLDNNLQALKDDMYQQLLNEYTDNEI